MCLLGVSSTLIPILGVKYPQNPNFWGVNRRFQAKRAKYSKFHVIETTASILTKFGVTIKTTKWSSWVVPVGAQQIQDGGWPQFWNPLNCQISSTVWPILMKFGAEILTDFDQIWHGDACWFLSACRKVQFFLFSTKWKWYPHKDDTVAENWAKN